MVVTAMAPTVTLVRFARSAFTRLTAGNSWAETAAPATVGTVGDGRTVGEGAAIGALADVGDGDGAFGMRVIGTTVGLGTGGTVAVADG